MTVLAGEELQQLVADYADKGNCRATHARGTDKLALPGGSRVIEATVAVWERGAGETLSSGTSAVAVAGAAVVNGWCRSPVVVHLAGGDMRVELDQEMNARLTGAAQEICTGDVSPELLAEVGEE